MGKCKTILVVDDDPFILDAFQSLLKWEGHRMIGVRCISEAIAQLFKEEVDLVITEVNLVGMSATGLPDLIKQLDRDLPVVVMSDLEEMDSARTLRQADLLLNKPLDLRETRAAITRLLTAAVEA